MTKKMLFYVGLVFIVSNLFYQEYFGLNTLIASVAIVTAYAFNQINRIKSIKWNAAALLFIFNGFSVFYNGSTLALWLYFISFCFFSAVHYNIKLSLPLGFVQAVQSFFSGFYYFIDALTQFFKTKEKTDANRILVRILLYSIPFLIAIIFLKLYQSADETFYEWTKFINLDWISWGFIGFYLFIFILFFGFYFFHGSQEIDRIENDYKNDIPSNYTDKVETFFGFQNERKIAGSLLITLNLMLLLYNCIDLHFIFVKLPNPAPTLRYSELLHGGVNSLITSIVLVIFIISFIYRGQLNFKGSKLIRIAASFWMIQNILMVTTTAIKNYEYIIHWGLTYKRIGVYVYLILAALGLIFTLIKILNVKSFWFLVRNTSIAFIICFSFLGCINWDKHIAQFNLTQLKPTQIDFDYILSLGKETYPYLMDYYKENGIEDDFVRHELFISYNLAKDNLNYKIEHASWRSLNLSERSLQSKFNKVKVIQIPDDSNQLNTTGANRRRAS